MTAGTPEEIMKWADEWFTYWIFQGERGDETGYEHWQGEGSLKKKQYQHIIIASMQRCKGVVPNYMQPIPSAQAKLIRGLADLKKRYAAKADTRINGPFESLPLRETYVPAWIQGKEARGWQIPVLEIAEQEAAAMNLRTIHWVYDPDGNHGKSTLAAIMAIKGKGVILPTLNDAKEITQALCNKLMDADDHNPGMIFLDLPRAMNKTQMSGFISACEMIKNGIIMDVRNHYKEWWIEAVSLWVFANVLPPRKALSQDRWVVWEFDGPGVESNLIPCYRSQPMSSDQADNDGSD